MTKDIYHWQYPIQKKGPGIDGAELPIFESDYIIFPVAYGVGIEYDADDWIQKIKKIIVNNINFLQQSHVKFVLFDLYEASKDLSKAANIFQQVLDKKIYVISANRKLLQKDSNTNIIIVFNDYWKTCMPSRDCSCKFTPKKLYINLTRVARFHRCMLLDQLFNANLFYRGYNTFSKRVVPETDLYFKMYPNSCINKINFNILDVKNLYKRNPNYFVPYQACKNSFVYLATETLVTNERMFFSEKIYKPIAIGIPFMVLGNPGTLSVLKALGYETFSKWFDEDYDLDYDIKDRIQIIVKNLKTYSDYTPNDLVKIRKEMATVCKKNLEIYKVHNKQNDLYNSIQKVLNV